MIYQPKGKAREYSPLALNYYKGCDHGCRYCYVPNIYRVARDSYIHVSQKDEVAKKLQKETVRYKLRGKQVLLCFAGDPYCEYDTKTGLTRSVLEILYQNKIPVAILTKGGTRILRDVDIIKRFGRHIKVGITLTFINPLKSKYWEPGAASPQDRIETLRILHELGIKTWVSLEPVIEPQQTVELIKATINFVEEYRIGKINNYQGVDKNINWSVFLKEVLQILRPRKKEIYVKNDLREAARNIDLYEYEMNMDMYLAEPWDASEQAKGDLWQVEAG